MENTKKYWSKSGIILGIILVIVNIFLSFLVYSDSDIRHPDGFSDLKMFAYPNVFLGLPILFASGNTVQVIIDPFYKTTKLPSTLDNSKFYNTVHANDIIIDNKRSAILFIQLFIILNLYWFFVGTFIMWIYDKLSKRSKEFYVVALILIFLGVTGFSLIYLGVIPLEYLNF